MVFIAPDLLGLLVFLVLPMLVALAVSLFAVDGFGNYSFAGLDNFRRMADDPLLHTSAKVTLTYLALYVPLVFVVSLALALLVRDPYPGVGAVRAALFLPNVVSLVVVGVLWQFMLVDKRGIVPALLTPLGLGEVSWLGDPRYALLTLVLVSIWFLAGYQMLIFLAGLKDIPGEYYDAARVDGASAWQRFTHVTMPGLRAVSSTVVLLSTVWTFNMFPVIFLLTRGGPGDSTEILVTYAYRLSFLNSPRDYATSAAWGVLILLLLALFAVVYRRSLRKQGEVW